MPQEYEKIETRLIKEGWVNPANFIKAKDEQARSKKSLYATLIRMGYMSEQKVYEFFSQSSLIPFVKVSDYKLDQSLLKLFPENSYRENCFLPLARVDETLYVAMSNPLDSNLISTLEMQANMQIYPLFAAFSEIAGVIDDLFGPDDRHFDLEGLIIPPQTGSVMPFWRESDRVVVKFDLEIGLDDERMKVASSVFIPATAVDMSASGKAIGIRTMLFLPATIKVVMRFPSFPGSGEVKGEIARCNMEKGGKYIIGIRFIDIKDEFLKVLASSK